MSFEVDFPASWAHAPAPPPPPDLSSVDPHRIEGMVNRFITAKQEALFTAPDAFYRQTGADAIERAPALLDRLAGLRTAALGLAQDDNERAVLGPRLELHVDDARDGIDRHVAKQQDTLARQIISERQTLIQRAAELDHNNDDKLGGLAEAHASAAQERARMNGEPDEPAAESARSAIWRAALSQRLAAGDSAQAVALFDRIKHQIAPADRRHLDLPIQLAATDIAADRWIDRQTATPGEPLPERAAADPDLSPAERTSILSKIAERTSATESARFATVKGLDDKHDAAVRALATASASYKPATFLALANAYDDADEPDKAAAARRLAEQENVLLRFAKSSVEEQRRLIEALPANAQDAAKAIQQQQHEAFARDPYAAGTALYPEVGPPLPAEDTEGRVTQTRMIEAMRGSPEPSSTPDEAANVWGNAPETNVLQRRATWTDGASPSRIDDPALILSANPPEETTHDGGQLAQANQPPAKGAPQKVAPKPQSKHPQSTVPSKPPSPEEIALEAERRAMKWVDFIYGQPDASKQKLLPDDWRQTANQEYVDWMRDAAKKNGVPLELLARHLYKESTFNPKAQNGSYKGMGQLGPSAVAEAGIKGKFDYFDAKSSIYASAAYLASLHRQVKSWPAAIAAYNAGPTRVGAWLRNEATRYEPKNETREAIRHVFRGNPTAFDD